MCKSLQGLCRILQEGLVVSRFATAERELPFPGQTLGWGTFLRRPANRVLAVHFSFDDPCVLSFADFPKVRQHQDKLGYDHVGG